MNGGTGIPLSTPLFVVAIACTFAALIGTWIGDWLWSGELGKQIIAGSVLTVAATHAWTERRQTPEWILIWTALFLGSLYAISSHL